MKPVFIIGFSRTGSTLLAQILNGYTDIGILPEMHILWPRRLHPDFATKVKKQIGGNLTHDNIDQLIELMFSKKIVGGFWKNIDRFNIDKSELKKMIMHSDGSIKGILDALFSILLKKLNKKIIGAKFPVHYSYVDKLLNWYPECKIIHTIRDPRAIFLSQFYKHKHKQNRNKIKIIISAIAQFIHVNYSFRGIIRFHNKYKICNNYHLHKYENIIFNPEKSLRELCFFLKIEFKEEMINPNVYYNTSLSERNKTIGIHKASLYAWKQKLPVVISTLIKLINNDAMKKVGYE